MKKSVYIEDPIVAEVRKYRQARAAKFNFDIRAIMEDARKRQALSGHPIIGFEQKGKAKKGRKATGKPLRKIKAKSAKR